ncbi:hypothetical protein GNY06_00400, partial [Elizabethkingia argentiflava]
ELPDVNFSNPSHKTLETSSLNNLSGNSDFMYFRKDMQVSGNRINHLDVVLKHQFCEINVKISSAETGYNISAIEVGIHSSHYQASNIKLSNAHNNYLGNIGYQKFALLSGLNTNEVSEVGIFNAYNDKASLSIPFITIGPLSKTNLTFFRDKVKIIPGLKYNLTVRLNPKDILLTYKGQPAARINGKIWMRHNLGANTSLDPDQSSSVAGIHGNYYQYGRNVSVAGATDTRMNSNFNGGYPPGPKAWNSGTEASPLKGPNDPCPEGYRVPTREEFQQLLEATIESNIGVWRQGNANYTAAKVFTSKGNKNVKMTFPSQGVFTVSANRNIPPFFPVVNPLERGNLGLYWASTLNNEGDPYMLYTQSSSSVVRLVLQ